LNTSGGTVAPGGTIGTLTVGSYTQGANSTLQIEVSPTAASLLNSLGAANLAGTLHLVFDPGVYTVHAYEIVAGNPVSGTFATVTQSGSPGVVFGVFYTPTQVDLLLTPTTDAEIFGGVSTATLGRAHGIASLVEDRLRDLRCTGRPDEQSRTCEGTEVWVEGLGATDGLDSQGTRFGYSNNAFGFVGGVDEHWSEGSTIGGAFAYESETLGMSAALSKASGSSYFGAIYGRWVAGMVFLDGEGFYMHTDWDVRRLVTGFGTALSNPSGDTKGGLLQVSVPVDDGDLRPYLRVTYAEFDRGSTAETGVGPIGYAVASRSTDLGAFEGGFLWSHAYAMSGNETLRPSLQLGFAEAFGGRTPIVVAGLVGVPGTTFTTVSASPAPTAGVVGASLVWDSGQDFELTSDARALVGAGQTQAEFTLGGVFHF
jgi:outer membrane autotransporter protein